MTRLMLLTLVLASSLAAAPPGTGTGPMQPQQPPAAPPPPAMTGGTSPAASPNPALLAQAQRAFAQLQSGNIDRTQLDSQMNAALTDDKIASVKSAIGPLGAPASFVPLRGGMNGTDTYAVYLVTFAGGTKFDFVYAVDAQGKVAGMQLTPP